jgi:hypothetical protein
MFLFIVIGTNKFPSQFLFIFLVFGLVPTSLWQDIYQIVSFVTQTSYDPKKSDLVQYMIVQLYIWKKKHAPVNIVFDPKKADLEIFLVYVLSLLSHKIVTVLIGKIMLP